MKSSKARKQRKAFFNAPLHKKRKHISSHLVENLLLKYDKRSIPTVKGDTVRIMRGVFKGHEDKVSTVHLKKQLVEVEGVTVTKADGKQIAQPVHPSNLLITKLNLTDKWRRRRLEEGLSAETKDEIEQEATDQIHELEEERKAEEERKKQEEAAAREEVEEEEVIEEEIPESDESIEEDEYVEEEVIESAEEETTKDRKGSIENNEEESAKEESLKKPKEPSESKEGEEEEKTVVEENPEDKKQADTEAEEKK